MTGNDSYLDMRTILIAACLFLTACKGPSQNDIEQPPIKSRDASEASHNLARYYARLERRLIRRGLMRTDGGGSDAPFLTEELFRDFQTLAFFGEYVSGQGFTKAEAQQAKLSKWVSPVRVRILFGPSVSAETQAKDTETVKSLLNQLSKITRHPIYLVQQDSNFDVLLANEDERYEMLTSLSSEPNHIGSKSMELLTDIPKELQCLVLAYTSGPFSMQYVQALAVIRAEHPPLLKQACFNEEISQGLGLSNDSPYARPSIFNDDDEFALLTLYDEILLSILYDPRLKPGMTLDTATPILRQIINEQTVPET